MATIHDVNANELIEKAAEELKKVESLKPPVWSAFAKTGINRERPPANRDWWYTRAAAVLRTIYKLGPIGTQKLRKKYGGRGNRGHKPNKVFKAGGSIIRKVLQQLEKDGLLAKATKGVHKGRVITAKGRKFLDTIASQIYKEDVKKKEQEIKAQKLEPKVEEKPKPVEAKPKEIIEKPKQEHKKEIKSGIKPKQIPENK